MKDSLCRRDWTRIIHVRVQVYAYIFTTCTSKFIGTMQECVFIHLHLSKTFVFTYVYVNVL